MITHPKSSVKTILVTLVAALGAAAASSMCCIGPLVYLVFGVSAAGLSGFVRFGWLQWPMIVLSLSLMGFGFWRLYFSRKPLCSGRFITRRRMLYLYWIAVPLVLSLQFYPFFLPWVLEVLA